ncbi:MAG: class I SAM-dependent methyltransferase [Pseudomonadota bacterium]
MKQSKASALEENKKFYTDLYEKRSFWAHLLHMRISFDQQSKAKLNKSNLAPFLEPLKAKLGDREPTVLDYGSGWGATLAKMPRDFKLYCYDLSELAMQGVSRSLRALGLDVRPAKIDEQAHIIEPKVVDLIICSHVLEHVADDDALLEVFYQALSEGGLLLLNLPINEVWEDPKHLRKYSQEITRVLLEQHNFEVSQVTEADRWTGYLLQMEFLSGEVSVLRRFYLRGLRGALAILPLWLVEMSERVFIGSRNCQQLVVVAKKVSQ